MKFSVTVKCPDALLMAIENAAEDEIGGSPTDLEADEQWNQLVAKTEKLCARWFKHNEILCVEIDTEAETCEVLET